MPELIADLLDPRLDAYRHLRRINKTRSAGEFVIEGHRVVRRLIDSGWPIRSILLSERRRGFLNDVLPAGVPVYVVPPDVAAQLVGYDFHHGVMACGVRPAAPDLASLVRKAETPTVLVCCPRITDPDNLGGLIRLCAGFGAVGLLLGDGSVDSFSRRVLRVSMGTAFTLPIIEAEDLAADLQRLREEHRFRLLATVLAPDATRLVDLPRTDRDVLLLGNESDGLDQQWIDLCDIPVTIPMATGIDSLNVTVAAGIFLHALRFGA